MTIDFLTPYSHSASRWGCINKEPLPLSSVRSTGIKETIMLKGLVLWAMGVPLVVIVLLYMFFF